MRGKFLKFTMIKTIQRSFHIEDGTKVSERTSFAGSESRERGIVMVECDVLLVSVNSVGADGKMILRDFRTIVFPAEQWVVTSKPLGEQASNQEKERTFAEGKFKVDLGSQRCIDFESTNDVRRDFTWDGTFHTNVGALITFGILLEHLISGGLSTVGYKTF